MALCLGAFLLSFLLPGAAEAGSLGVGGGQGDSWNTRRKGRRGEVKYALEFGARYNFHYSGISVISTPPDSKVGEVILHAWFGKAMALYGTFSRAIDQSGVSTFGMGFKVPFITFATSNEATAVSGISLMLAFDINRYRFPTPRLPMVYPETGTLLRGGGSIHWMFGTTGLYLDTTAMATYWNSNFFIAPLLGLGYHF